MVAITVVSPVAGQRLRPAGPPAPRLDDLNGRVIGLYWNLKAGGDVALRRIAATLAERYTGLTFHNYSGTAGARPTMTASDAERIVAECDAVIASAADTGGSTSWLAHDMVQIEERGVPSVTFVAAGMSHEWAHSAVAFGMPSLRGAVIPHGLASTTHAEIDEFVDAAIDGVVAGLTAAAPAVDLDGADESDQPDETLSVEGEDQLDATAHMNTLFVDRGWGDGFPLVPPTRAAVARMLAGTSRAPEDVVAILEPAFGIATVLKIAVNAVLAGAAPEHMPVLIAAVEAVADPHFMLRDAIASTGVRSLLLLINGPIRQRLGINCGTNAIGPGGPSRANIVIGRAMRLIYMNIAGGYSGTVDVGTVGLPTKFSLCAGENEEASPWEPFHVDAGFSRETSTVTAKTVFGATETQIRRENTPEAILDLAAAAAASTGAHVGWLTGGTADPDKGVEVQPQSIWLICPEHAQSLAAAGYDKARIQQYLYEHAKVPLRKLFARYEISRDRDGNWLKNPHLQHLEKTPDLMVPVVSDPADFKLAVVGGPGPRGVWFWGHEEAVTREIEVARG